MARDPRFVKEDYAEEEVREIVKKITERIIEEDLV